MVADSLIVRWLRNLINEEVNREIDQKFESLKRSLLHRKDSYIQSTDVVKINLGAEHEILRITHPCFFFGYIDFSELRHGDSVEVTLLVRPAAHRHYREHRKAEYAGPMVQPLVEFREAFAEGVIVKIKQLTGTKGRSVYFNFRWKGL